MKSGVLYFATIVRFGHATAGRRRVAVHGAEQYLPILVRRPRITMVDKVYVASVLLRMFRVLDRRLRELVPFERGLVDGQVYKQRLVERKLLPPLHAVRCVRWTCFVAICGRTAPTKW